MKNIFNGEHFLVINEKFNSNSTDFVAFIQVWRELSAFITESSPAFGGELQ